MKGKLAKLMLSLLTILFVFQLSTVEANAESASSAMHRAAKKYGWTWTDLGCGANTYYVAQCTLDGVSNKHLYFAQWEVQPTCTSGGKAILSCVFANQYGGVEASYIHQAQASSYGQGNVGALGHEYQVVSTTPATCTSPGVTTYRCPHCGSTTTSQTQAALGHSYDTPTYAWSNYENCVATRICLNNSSHVETETCNATSEITKNATCTENGIKTYSVVFSNTAFIKQTKEEVIIATGHTLDARNCINCDYIDPLLMGTTSKEGVDLNVDIKIYDSTEEEEVRNVLNNNMILDSAKDIIGVIEIKTENPGTTEVELNLKHVANEGDEVTLFNVNKQTAQCENVSTFTLDKSETVTYETNTEEPIVIIQGKLENNTATNTTTVYAEVGSEFKVIIPKKVVLDGATKSGTYQVTVEGDIAGLEVISVTPDSAVTLSSKDKADVIGTITQDKITWAYNEILSDNKILGNGEIDANGITAGAWNGTFNFVIKLENNGKYNDSIEDVEYICIQYKPSESE